MKKRFAIIAFIGALVMGFSSPVLAAAENPGASVKNFYTLMSKGEWTAANKYLASKELTEMIGGLENIYKHLSAAEKKKDAMDSYGAMANLKVVSEKVTGDKAVVVVTYKEKKKEKKETYNLKKVNGTWKIVD